MTRKTNPFADFDMFKAFADFDPAKATEQFTKMFQGMEMPKADIDAMMASQRKTLEAFNAANQAALEGVRDLVAKTNVAASEPINARIQEGFDEVKAISEQLAK